MGNDPTPRGASGAATRSRQAPTTAPALIASSHWTRRPLGTTSSEVHGRSGRATRSYRTTIHPSVRRHTAWRAAEATSILGPRAIEASPLQASSVLDSISVVQYRTIRSRPAARAPSVWPSSVMSARGTTRRVQNQLAASRGQDRDSRSPSTPDTEQQLNAPTVEQGVLRGALPDDSSDLSPLEGKMQGTLARSPPSARLPRCGLRFGSVCSIFPPVDCLAAFVPPGASPLHLS